MPLQVISAEGVTIVRLNEEDLNGPDLEANRDKLFILASPGKLVLDFTKVGYLTSLALGTLMALHKRVKAAGGHLLLENISPRVYAVFAITRLTKLFDIRTA